MGLKKRFQKWREERQAKGEWEKSERERSKTLEWEAYKEEKRKRYETEALTRAKEKAGEPSRFEKIKTTAGKVGKAAVRGTYVILQGPKKTTPRRIRVRPRGKRRIPKYRYEREPRQEPIFGNPLGSTKDIGLEIGDPLSLSGNRKKKKKNEWSW